MDNYAERNKDIIAKVFQRTVANVQKELKTAGQIMKDDAENTLKTNNMYSGGEIVKTVSSSVVKTPALLRFEFGCYAKSDSGYPYPSVVEYGRRAGKKPPPVESIQDWLILKGRSGHMSFTGYSFKSVSAKTGKTYIKSVSQLQKVKSELTTLAFLIARKIGKQGIKAKPFMTPAWQKGIEYLKQVFA